MYYARVINLGQRTNSGQPGGTAGRILEHARKAFNERGVAAVGVREIARDLGLSPGNVSYHYPTKEALVTALMADTHARNNALAEALPAGEGFEDVVALVRGVMRRDLENRWFFREVVGLLVAFPELRPVHVEMQRARDLRTERILGKLVSGGLLDGERVKRRLPELRMQLFTQIFFWLPSAILAAPDADPADRLELHLRAAMALLLPYCTPGGRRRLETVLDR
ncbi:MAG: TetR/AcrR family transcriptional regulator [Myxococcaceae bacterium]|nr:MAG: TetR/AcrR family transcriptional regulator [Myxococcaceae bacterium]